MRVIKKYFSLLLVLCMIAMLVPALPAYADVQNGEIENITEEIEEITEAFEVTEEIIEDVSEVNDEIKEEAPEDNKELKETVSETEDEINEEPIEKPENQEEKPTDTTPKEEPEYVCYIGDAGYEWLEVAVAVAEEYDVITLCENVEESVVIAPGKAVTIDLNGNCFSGDIENRGTLLLTDRSVGGCFDGSIISLGYTEYIDDAPVPFVGFTELGAGSFSGNFVAAQLAESPLAESDPLPVLKVTGGRFYDAEFATGIFTVNEDDENTLDFNYVEGAGSISISGGAFMIAPPSEYVSEGMQVAEIEDGTSCPYQIVRIAPENDEDDDEALVNNDDEEIEEREANDVFDDLEYEGDLEKEELVLGEAPDDVLPLAKMEKKTAVLKEPHILMGAGMLSDSPNSINITYINVDSTENPNPDSFLSGETLTLESAVRKGSHFDGWYKDSGLTGEPISEVLCSEDITLYAKWTEGIYRIIYNDPGEGSLAPTEISTSDVNVPLPEAMDHLRNFLGWYETTDYSGSPISHISGAGLTDDVVLYGKWAYKEYNIIYVDEGKFNPNPTTINTSQTLTLVNAEDPSRKFYGWYDNEKFTGNRITSIDGSHLTDDVTLYGKWIDTYKVRVFYNSTNGNVYHDGNILPYSDCIIEEFLDTPVKLSYSPNSGYYVYNVTIDGVKKGSVGSSTIEPKEGTTIVVVTFTRGYGSPYTGDDGSVSSYAAAMAISGMSMALFAFKGRRKKNRS